MNPLVFLPGAAALLFTAIEMPRNVKKTFFKIPIWLSSSAISIIVGIVGRGVLGPTSGFMTELLLFPGLYVAKKHFNWTESRRPERESNRYDTIRQKRDERKTSRVI